MPFGALPDPIDHIVVGDFTAEVLVSAPMGYSNGQNGPNFFVTYLLSLDDADRAPQFVDTLIGIGTYSSSIFSWPAPHQFPGSKLICLQAGLHEFLGPVKPSSQLFGSDYVAIRAEYGTASINGLDYDVFGDQNAEFLGMEVPWSSVEMDGHTEEHEITGLKVTKAAVAATDTTPAEPEKSVLVKRGKRRVGVFEYQIGRSYIPNLAAFVVLMRGLVDHVNMTTFLGADPGTVLFSDPGMRNRWEATGNITRSFVMTFRERQVPWNQMLVPNTSNEWAIPEDEFDLPSITYPSGELNLLLQYGII